MSVLYQTMRIILFNCTKNLSGLASWSNLYTAAFITSLQDEVAAHAGKPFVVGALRGSDANRFYARHGFVLSAESEWDLTYLRPPSPDGR